MYMNKQEDEYFSNELGSMIGHEDYLPRTLDRSLRLRKKN